MQPRSWRVSVQDILDAIGVIQRVTRGLEFEGFAGDILIRSTVLLHLMIIGEASANVPVVVQNQASGIPWALMRGIRNRVAHAYFHIDLLIVWDVVMTQLDPLVPQLQALLESDFELGR